MESNHSIFHGLFWLFYEPLKMTYAFLHRMRKLSCVSSSVRRIPIPGLLLGQNLRNSLDQFILL